MIEARKKQQSVFYEDKVKAAITALGPNTNSSSSIKTINGRSGTTTSLARTLALQELASEQRDSNEVCCVLNNIL